uniref:Uncharacterized protein n=1 Tax=Arundo donax TaxID=35708 RepID=A0A0A9H875_ARUDO
MLSEEGVKPPVNAYINYQARYELGSTSVSFYDHDSEELEQSRKHMNKSKSMCPCVCPC